MGRDFDDGVFGDVIKDDRRKEEQAKREAQRSGRAGGSGAGAASSKRPQTREPDAFDQLGGGKADPDARAGGKAGGGRVKLGN